MWNILGSCWIRSAFVYYPRGFSVCYLVCVILSWISVVASPCFVFFGKIPFLMFTSQVDCYTHGENRMFLSRKGIACFFSLRLMCLIILIYLTTCSKIREESP